MLDLLKAKYVLYIKLAVSFIMYLINSEFYHK